MKSQLKYLLLYTYYVFSPWIVAFLPFIPFLICNNGWYCLLFLITLPCSFAMFDSYGKKIAEYDEEDCKQND